MDNSCRDYVATVQELADKWVKGKKPLSKVPPGGYDQLLAAYRHPIHVDKLTDFLKRALARTVACEVRHTKL